MIATMQVLLPLGAAVLYLFDCTMLLHDDEVVLTRCGDTWRVASGSDFTLLNRRPYLANPFRPDRLSVRAGWSLAELHRVSTGTDGLRRLDRLLAPVKVLVVLLLVLLMVALPVASVLGGGGVSLLVVFVVYYVSVVAALAVIGRRRAALGLTPKQFGLLAVDVLACPPFAVNLVRKASLTKPIPGGVIALALQGDVALRAQLLDIVESRLRTWMVGEEPGTDAHGRLSAAAARIVELRQ